MGPFSPSKVLRNSGSFSGLFAKIGAANEGEAKGSLPARKQCDFSAGRILD